MATPILMEAMRKLADIYIHQHETLGALVLIDRGDYRIRLAPLVGYLIEHDPRSWPVTYREAFFAMGGEAGARAMFARIATELPDGEGERSLKTWCEWCAEGDDSSHRVLVITLTSPVPAGDPVGLGG